MVQCVFYVGLCMRMGEREKKVCDLEKEKKIFRFRCR